MTLTLYSTTTCAPCKIVARKFTDAGVPFVKIDLDQPEHADTLADLKHSLNTDLIHTPTIIENGVVAMAGMNHGVLQDLIASHRRDDKPLVHNHGPWDGPGTDCREHRLPSGALRGACMEPPA